MANDNIKLDIGFDAKRLFHNVTGLGNYARTMLGSLKKFYPNYSYTLFSPSSKKGISQADRTTIVTNRRVTPNWIWRSFFCLKDINRSKINIYHGLSNELPFFSSQKKMIVTIHDLIFEQLPETYSFINKHIYRLKFRSACKKADAIVAISESTKKDIIQFYDIDASKIKVIYQACLPSFYEPIDPSNDSLEKFCLPKKYFLYVGSIIPRKNIELIINALALLPKQKKLPLVVIGKGKQHQAKLIKQAQSLNVEEDIYWISNVQDTEDLKQIYHRAECLIYPSLYEGFGLPITEAMLCKTPVIAAKTSSLTEAGGDAAIYVDPTDSKQLSIEMMHITSTTKRNKIIKKGYKFAKDKFDSEKLSNQMIHLYRSLL